MENFETFKSDIVGAFPKIPVPEPMMGEEDNEGEGEVNLKVKEKSKIDILENKVKFLEAKLANLTPVTVRNSEMLQDQQKTFELLYNKRSGILDSFNQSRGEIFHENSVGEDEIIEKEPIILGNETVVDQKMEEEEEYEYDEEGEGEGEYYSEEEKEEGTKAPKSSYDMQPLYSALSNLQVPIYEPTRWPDRKPMGGDFYSEMDNQFSDSRSVNSSKSFLKFHEENIRRDEEDTEYYSKYKKLGLTPPELVSASSSILLERSTEYKPKEKTGEKTVYGYFRDLPTLNESKELGELNRSIERSFADLRQLNLDIE